MNERAREVVYMLVVLMMVYATTLWAAEVKPAPPPPELTVEGLTISRGVLMEKMQGLQAEFMKYEKAVRQIDAEITRKRVAAKAPPAKAVDESTVNP